MSKDLVEVQIEANKMREKYEAEIFELQNKVIHIVYTLYSVLQKCFMCFSTSYVSKLLIH